MASNAFGSKRPPSGTQFRRGPLGQALKDAYKDIEEAFLYTEQHSSGVQVFADIDALKADTNVALRVNGTIVGVGEVAVIPTPGAPDLPMTYQWLDAINAWDSFEEQQDWPEGPTMAFAPDDVFAAHEDGVWINTIMMYAAMSGGGSNNLVQLFAPAPLNVSPANGDTISRFLTGPGHATNPNEVATWTDGAWVYSAPDSSKEYYYAYWNAGATLTALNAFFYWRYMESGGGRWTLEPASNSYKLPMIPIFAGYAADPDDLATPPTFGKLYAVKAGATGVWESRDGQAAWLEADGVMWAFSGSDAGTVNMNSRYVALVAELSGLATADRVYPLWRGDGTWQASGVNTLMTTPATLTLHHNAAPIGPALNVVWMECGPLLGNSALGPGGGSVPLSGGGGTDELSLTQDKLSGAIVERPVSWRPGLGLVADLTFVNPDYHLIRTLQGRALRVYSRAAAVGDVALSIEAVGSGQIHGTFADEVDRTITTSTTEAFIDAM